MSNMNNNFNSNSTRPPSGNGNQGHWNSPLPSPVGKAPSLMDQQQSLPNVARVVVTRDGGGYGMKVSGDNPVYVQSVKDGGPAEKAGLHAGDRIIQVNGTNVMHSTHTEVVALIKAHTQVVLTVQQRTSLRSPGSRPASLPSTTKITAPQPVDNEKQYQLQQERDQYYRLMIEEEQHHLDKLKAELAACHSEKKALEMAKVEKNLRILLEKLSRTLNENASGDVPPPLPPRTYLPPHNNTHIDDASRANSIDKQMSYPLVATCTYLQRDCPSNAGRHSRTKSNPDSLTTCTDGSQRPPATPPGTPPPPYPCPEMGRQYQESSPLDQSHSFNASFGEMDVSHIKAASSRTPQQTIISMEDDDISDLEIDQLEDHNYFKSLSRLWEHLPHLAVFMNYVLSNSDPNSLLFYLLTDLYKEGNAKEMRKWAFEIHSCFLVPGAPLRLNNVDENIAREIDDELTKEYEKEEIMRKVFWKARHRAKEELTRQLADFQQKRTAGLGTMYGPTDLMDHYNDKMKEAKLYESLFIPKVELYLDELDKETYDPQKAYLAAALITILTRVFRVRSQNLDLDRVPTFVNKERSFKAKFFGKYSRKLNHLGHQFVAQQYFTVILCNACSQIIYGISPQGYECTACKINLHRPCVKLYEDTCPGPFRGKERGLRKLIGMRHEASEQQNRARKTSQFIHMEKEKRQMEDKDWGHESTETGDAKITQPVSRSGSDRRSDSVREEGARSMDDSQPPTDGAVNHSETATDKKEISTNSESPSNSHVSGMKKRVGSHINRSESVKEQSEKIRKQQRRNVSDPSHTKNANFESEGGENVDLKKNADSGGSSNSSISAVNGVLSESPSNSMDVHQATVRSQSDSDSDLDGEADPLNWQDLITEEELKKLNSNEKKRQEVINELFLTEKSHIRMLRVLYKVFYKSLQNNQVLKPEEMNLIFPNIKELFDIHSEIYKEMRRIRKEDPLVRQIGDMLVATFTGASGEALQRAAATFCQRQQLALDFIKKRRERDSKFDSLLSECEKKRECRRLQLQGILPYEMQRLTRYSLLLERLIKSVEAAEKTCSEYKDELVKLRQAHNGSKEILGFVDEAAKLAHNRHRLEEIQRHLDMSNFRNSDHPIVTDFKNFDLTRYKLILEGGLQLRRPNKTPVPVHILLMEEMVVILQKESDKFLLKFFQSQLTPLSPIIKMSTLLVRENAVCKNCLFLVNTSTTSSQMYDLQAEDEAKRETWRKQFQDAADAYNRREGKPSRAPMVTQPVEPVSDSDSETTSTPEVPVVDPAGTVENEPALAEVSTESAVNEEDQSPLLGNESVSVKNEEEAGCVDDPRAGGDHSPDENNSGVGATIGGGGNGIHITTKVSAEDWPLIQPSQVNVAVPPVHTAESMLTPLEQIRRKDALVKQTLAEKENLVADMLAIPREHFEHIADMASATTSDDPESHHNASDITDRLLASVFQVDILQKAVNDALNITESEVILAHGGKNAACASQDGVNEARSVIPSVPASLVGSVAASLTLQLTMLMREVKQVEEERDRLRKELHKIREKLHEEHKVHSPVPFDESEDVFSEAISGESD